jgi:hypothetical protein
MTNDVLGMKIQGIYMAFQKPVGAALSCECIALRLEHLVIRI